MCDFRIVSYKEGVFKFESSDFQRGEKVNAKMSAVMRKDNADRNFIVLQLTAVYEAAGKEIMKYGGLLAFLSVGWQDLDENSEEFREFKLGVWRQTQWFFRGVICEKLRGTELETYFLPQMPDEEILAIQLV